MYNVIHYFVWRHVSSLMTLARHVCIVWHHSCRSDTLYWYLYVESAQGCHSIRSCLQMWYVSSRYGQETRLNGRTVFTVGRVSWYLHHLHRSVIVFVVFSFQQKFFFCWRLHLSHSEQNINASNGTRVSLIRLLCNYLLCEYLRVGTGMEQELREKDKNTLIELQRNFCK